MGKQIELLIILAREYYEFGKSLKMKDWNHFDIRQRFDSWDALVGIYINGNNPEHWVIKFENVSIREREITLPSGITTEVLEAIVVKATILLNDLKTTRFKEVKESQKMANQSEIEIIKLRLAELEAAN